MQNYLKKSKPTISSGNVLTTIYFAHKQNDSDQQNTTQKIKVITKLPNSEQSYKGKVKTHNYINRQNQSTTGKL